MYIKAQFSGLSGLFLSRIVNVLRKIELVLTRWIFGNEEFWSFIELLYFFFLELKAKEKKKNGQGILSSVMPGSAGGNQNFIYLYPMTFCITSGGKFWYPEYLEIVSDEIWILSGEIVCIRSKENGIQLRFWRPE